MPQLRQRLVEFTMDGHDYLLSLHTKRKQCTISDREPGNCRYESRQKERNESIETYCRPRSCALFYQSDIVNAMLPVHQLRGPSTATSSTQTFANPSLSSLISSQKQSSSPFKARTFLSTSLFISNFFKTSYSLSPQFPVKLSKYSAAAR